MHATSRRQITLAQFANRRIGDGTQAQQVANLLVRPFAAPSFIGFWRLWNPLYGYVLYRWCYRPLRSLLPRPAAELATFAASGFVLHDIPLFVLRRDAGAPLVTLWFVLAGGIAIACEAGGIGFRGWPAPARIAANTGYLLATLCAVVGGTLAVGAL